MGSVRITVDIERPLAEVFAYVTDLRHDVNWFDGIRSVHVVSNVDYGVGAVFEQATSMFGWRFTSRLRVTEYEPPTRMVLVADKSMIPFRATYAFERTMHGIGTRFTLDATVHGAGIYRLLGPLFLPMLHAAVTRRFARLKRVLES
jgi:uncharacterized protein YndB with AHSA1/START domain